MSLRIQLVEVLVDVNGICGFLVKALGHIVIGSRIVGTHMSMTTVDEEKTAELIKSNPDLFFVLIDDETACDVEKGERIGASCENCLYLGPRSYGMSHWGYADFSAVFCPPLLDNYSHELTKSFALALSTGRWLLYCDENQPNEILPYAINYEPRRPLPAIWNCSQNPAACKIPL